MLVSLLLLSVIAGLTVVYVLMKRQFSYWRRKNIAYFEPLPIIGNMKGLFTMKQCIAEQLTDLYNDVSVKDHAVFGIYLFNKPALVIKDPELLEIVLIKDFNSFANRFASTDPDEDPLAYNNLFFSTYTQWKELRTKVSPVFTTGKLRNLFKFIDEIGYDLDNHLCKLTEIKKISTEELKEISALFGTDVIASVAFGVRANSLQDKNSEFRRNGKTVFSWSLYKSIQFHIIFFLPQFVKLFRTKMFSKEAAKFLRDSINFVMADREKTGILRGDLIDVLVKLKQASIDKGEVLEMDKLIAQAAVFFIAGFETISSVISFGLHELSRKSDLQKRLRDEIKTKLIENNGKLTYESLNEMQYLDMVISEVLRMYPPQPFLDRKCVLGKGKMEFSLKPYIDLSIPHGMPVFIPIYSIHRDPKYFPNPDVFDPERFSPDNKPNITPFTYMPFGAGPRNCIGKRLAILQAKVGIVNFLKNHYVEPCEKSHKVMQLDPKGVLLSAKNGIHVNLVRDPLVF